MSSAEKPQNGAKKPFAFARNIAITASLSIISLGSFSEAILLIEDFYHQLQSHFSNTFEYSAIGSIRVGNTEQYIESKLGNAQVSQSLGESNLVAKYYFDKKYLATVIYSEHEAQAYLILCLAEGFTPETPWNKGQSIGNVSFANLSPTIIGSSTQSGATNSYYVEAFSLEKEGLFLESYAGIIGYATPLSNLEQLERLDHASVYETDQIYQDQLDQFRKQATPNLFGEGIYSLAIIEKSLLSNGRFQRYFKSLN